MEKSNKNPFQGWLTAFLHAQHQFRRGDFALASNFLQEADAAASNANGSSADKEFFRKFGYCRRCLQLNSHGCIFDRLQKPHLALVYFCKALRQRESVVAEILQSSVYIYKKLIWFICDGIHA